MVQSTRRRRETRLKISIQLTAYSVVGRSIIYTRDGHLKRGKKNRKLCIFFYFSQRVPSRIKTSATRERMEIVCCWGDRIDVCMTSARFRSGKRACSKDNIMRTSRKKCGRRKPLGRENYINRRGKSRWEKEKKTPVSACVSCVHDKCAINAFI